VGASSMDRSFDSQLEHALRLLHLGSPQAAEEALKEALSLEPQSAPAHALLAMCLLSLRRLHAAEHEARLALGLAPDAALPHLVLGQILFARRRLRQAEEHLARAAVLDPDDPDHHRALASLLDFTGRRREGRAALAEGRLLQARARAQEALEQAPEHGEALVLMGNVLLRQGDVERAREHAHWAVRQDPTDRGALHLLASVKARSNPFLGLWWRWTAWMGTTGDGTEMLVVIVPFLLYRVGEVALKNAGLANAAQLLQWVWMAIVAYTWFAPAIFRRMLQKELSEVRLKPGF